MFTEILGILIAALLSQNFILVKFYGTIAVSKAEIASTASSNSSESCSSNF